MMSVRFQSWNYLVAFLACALLSALAFAIGQMTFDSIPCKWRGYSADDFLAYCRSQRYADYEHGAFYYGLEPDIRSNVRNAKVLFLGSSKIQAAFSTNAVRSYFDKLRIDFFVMGFGYAESSRFALSVLQRSEATPRLLVINADPFFTEHVSVPGQEAFDGGPAFLWRLALKFTFQRVHRAICFAAPFVCPESEPAIFRSKRHGQWNWIGPYTAEKAVPFDGKFENSVPSEEIAKAINLGERFLRDVGLNRACVVITGTPNTFYDSVGIAQTLAAALKTNSLFPSSAGLSTLDGVHLNLASAELWSGRFVEGLSPILNACLK
jgi:hypothetical protein